MRRVKRLITKQRIEKKIEHSSIPPQPSLEQSADVGASGLSDVSSVEDLLLRREGASGTTQNIQNSSRGEGYQPPSARCDTLLMGYSENDYTQKRTNTNTNHSTNNKTNQHTTTVNTTTNLNQPCNTLFNMSHTNTETTMEEIIELDAIPSSAITTDIMSPDKILSHHHLGDDEEEEDEGSPMDTTTTPRTNLLTQPQQQQQQQEDLESSQELTPEDEQIMNHTLSSCSTLREQLFHLCTLTNDRGQRILRYMLNRQQQSPLSDSNNNAGDEKNNNNNNTTNTTNTPTTPTNNTTTTTQPATTTTTTNNTTTFDINKLLDVSRNNTSLMHVCARMNNVGCLEVLHQNGGLIDIQDDLNATPLFYACAHNCQECAVYLLSQGANPNHKDRYGGHSLAICLRNDHLDLMKILVLFNADIHLKGQRGNTCLHLACAEGRIKKVRYLLEDCRASVKRTNRDDEHVLFSALPNIGVIDYLCDSLDQKELTSLLSRVSSFGTTVFHKCCEMGYLDTLMSIMRKYMAKATSTTDNSNTTLAHKKQSLEFLATRLNEGDTTRGYTPLHYAVIHERVEVVKFLLSINDIAINHCDLNGDTALHHAIHVGNRAMCDTLIQYGASVRIRNHKNMACWEAARDVDIKLNTSEISALEYLWHRKNKKTSLKKNILHQASLV